jgi:3-hydroxybutyryl-CoA dehydrogenase/5-formyl-3-hydroxy-2-methylpyridine 4-carboxylate dehydrogenase
VNVRATPSAAGTQLAILPPFAPVQIIGVDPNGKWYEIMYPDAPGGTGWVTEEYIYVPQGKDTIPVIGGAPTAESAPSGTPGTPGASASGVVLQQINVRKGPGTQFDALGTLDPQDTVTLTGKSPDGTWLQIQYSGGTGWVAAAFIDATGVESLPIVGETGAVIGTGTMGPGMGAVLARAGIGTALYDVSTEALERARAATEIASGVLERLDAAKEDGGGLRFESDLAAALDGADLVLEAVPEKLELKHEVFPKFEEAVAPEAILASNTSGIPITKIATVCRHPERVVGLHWSNPPHLIPMIEVIPGEQTSQETVDAVSELVRRVGYHPVVEKEVAGFVENRILYAILRECLDLVDRGIIDPEGLDLNVRWGIGYKLAVIGPMELLDMAGLDIYQAVGSYLNQDLSTSGEVSGTIRDLIEKGRLGMKTGGGIYDYTPEQIDKLRAARAGKLVAVRKALEA